MRTYKPADRVGAEECYLLFQRGLFGRRGMLIGAWRSASDVLAAIGTSWPSQPKERLYAVYQNGNMREVKQTVELMSTDRPLEGATF
jgi:hypothetical protein